MGVLPEFNPTSVVGWGNYCLAQYPDNMTERESASWCRKPGFAVELNYVKSP